MWADDAALVKAIADQLLRQLRPQESKSGDYEPEPLSFKPEPIPRGETYLESLQRKIRDDVRSGRAVTMNSMQPAKPRPETKSIRDDTSE